MSETEFKVEEILAVTDPGEVGRENHGPLDRLMVHVANVVAWAFPLLMVMIVAQVILRSNGYNQAWLDDAQWWVYGFAMLTGFGYAITNSSHVRVDIFHQNYSTERKARVECFAIGWLLLPFIVIMTDVLFHYAVASVKSGEGSDSPNGLHNLYLLKCSLPILFTLAGLAAYASFKRHMRQFTDITLDRVLLWMLPTAIFIASRVVEYLGYWTIYLTNDEIKARRITREPFFDYTTGIAIAVVLAIIVIAALRRRGASA